MKRSLKIVLPEGHPWPFTGPFIEESVYIMCGYRYGNYISVQSFHPVPNASPIPEDEFLVLRRDMHTVPPNIVGVAHRHPPGLPQPSEQDYAGIPRGLLGAVWCEGDVNWYLRNRLVVVTVL